MTDSWEALMAECARCRECALGQTRKNLVFGTGNPRAEIMLVGEGPGANEDEQGVPFVGKAGMLLDDMLAIIGLDRTKVYIANIVKCPPPGNRDPLNVEQDAARSGWWTPGSSCAWGGSPPCGSSTSGSRSPGSMACGTMWTAGGSWPSTTPPPCCGTRAAGRRPLTI